MSGPALLARFVPFVYRPENTGGEVGVSDADVAACPKGFQDIGNLGRLRGRVMMVAVGGGRSAGVARGRDDVDGGVNKGGCGIGRLGG